MFLKFYHIFLDMVLFYISSDKGLHTTYHLLYKSLFNDACIQMCICL